MPRVGAALSIAAFDEIALFLEIAEAGSLTAAARRLAVPKSTVSRALSRLEHKLGVALVRRSIRGHALTEQGRDLALAVAPHVVGIRDAAQALGRARDEPYGTVRITAPIDVGEQILGPLLPRFLARYPRVQVEVDISQRFVDVIGEGVDLALRASSKPLAASSLRSRKLADLQMGLFAAPSYLARVGKVLRPSDLALCDHVLFRANRGSAQLTLEGPGGASEVSVSGRLVTNDFHFLRRALLAGAGIGGLPWFMANADVEAKRLTRILPRHTTSGATLYLLVAPGRPLPRKTEVLRDYLIEHAPRALRRR